MVLNRYELADLIEAGLKYPDVCEDRHSFLNAAQGKYFACALGLAAIGKFGGPETARMIIASYQLRPDSLFATMAEILDSPIDLVSAVNCCHFLGSRAAWIVERLRNNTSDQVSFLKMLGH